MLYTLAVYCSDRFFERQIGRGLYNANDLTEVTIPINTPGTGEWPVFHDMYGEVRFENTAYNYVKIRMTRNAIHLLCVPNYKTTKLCGQNIIDARKIGDVPINKKDHVPAGKMLILNVFNQPPIHYCFTMPSKPVQGLPSIVNSEVVESSIIGPGQPPELA